MSLNHIDSFVFALIQAFKHKLDHEINSSIYAVAALFNVSKFHTWYSRTDCENIRTKAGGNKIDIIERFEQRTSVATEAAEASNVSIPSDDDPSI
jgi:hypothetical protein